MSRRRCQYAEVAVDGLISEWESRLASNGPQYARIGELLVYGLGNTWVVLATARTLMTKLR
jgi:hypothetical protein